MRGMLIVSLGLGVWSGLAGAAESEDAGGSTETVTVVATRNPTPALTFPGMVDVLGPEQIAAAVPSTVSDLVWGMPNVQFAGGPRRTGETPSVRGLGGEDVLVLIDGVRQSWTSGHDGRFFLDPALLSAVEVVKGPSSALYGSGALGGVLAFRTADASDLLSQGGGVGGRVTLGYQGVDDEFLRTLTAFTHAGAFDFIGSLGERSSGGIRLGSGADLAADDDIVTGFAKAGYDFAPGIHGRVSYQGFRNHAVEPADGQGLSTGSPVNKSTQSQQYSAGLDAHPPGQDLLNLSATVYHIDGSVTNTDPASLERTRRNIKTDGVSADNRMALNAGTLTSLLTVGAEWYRDTQTGRDTAGVNGQEAGVPDGEDRFWGVFAQLEAHIARPLGAPGDLTVIPAIRYDSYRNSAAGYPDVDRTAVSPKLALTYAPLEQLFVFGNGGKAFRAPGINELYLDGVHFSVPHPILPDVAVANSFLANPQLRPEESRYWEAGAGLVFHQLLAGDDTLSLKASYWSQKVDDYIALSVYTPDTFYSVGCFTPPTFLDGCNVGYTTSANVDAQLHGTEIEAVYDAPRARLAVDYGTLSGRQRGTPYDLPSLMPDTVSAQATWKLPELHASLSVRVQHADGFHKSYDPASNDPSTETRAGYTVLDLYGGWSPAFVQGLQLNAGIDNLTDRNYAPYQAGVSAPGRNFKVLVSYTPRW